MACKMNKTLNRLTMAAIKCFKKVLDVGGVAHLFQLYSKVEKGRRNSTDIKRNCLVETKTDAINPFEVIGKAIK